jgi:hypothetical protein
MVVVFFFYLLVLCSFLPFLFSSSFTLLLLLLFTFSSSSSSSSSSSFLFFSFLCYSSFIFKAQALTRSGTPTKAKSQIADCSLQFERKTEQNPTYGGLLCALCLFELRICYVISN